MVLAALVEAFGPTLAREAVSGGAKYAAGQAAGRFVGRKIAGEAGQRLAGRVVGERVASKLATRGGQKAVSMYASKQTRDVLGGGEKPEADTSIYKDYGDKWRDNYDQETNPNLTQAPATPGRSPSMQRQQGRLRGGGGGGGPGWWTAGAITDPMKAGYDWRTLSNTSVARGPSSWNMAGRGMGRRALARGVGFAEGYAGAQGQGVEPGPVDPGEIDKINENLSNTWPTTKPTDPSKNYQEINQNLANYTPPQPTSRTTAFTFGSDSDLGYGSRNPVGPVSTYPRPSRSGPYTGGSSFS